MERQNGFTLFDILVTIAILAMVLSFGVPSMRAGIEKRNTTSVAEDIYSQIQLARSEAIARSQPVYINLAGGADWAIGISTDLNCDPTDNDPACTLPDADGANAITHRVTAADHEDVSLATTSNQIVIEPQRGTATSATIDITSTGSKGYVVTINIGLLGQVSLCSSNADPSKYVTGYRACS